MIQEGWILIGGRFRGRPYGARESSASAGSSTGVEPGFSTTATLALRRGRSRCFLKPEFDSDLCGEGRVGEISLSSLNEAAAGAGVCLRGFGLA